MGGWKIALWIVVVAAALWFLYMVRGVLSPFVLGYILAILMDPIVRRMRVKGFSRKFAVFTVFGGLLGICLMFSFFIPLISNQITGFSTGITSLTREFAAQSYQSNYFVRWNPKVRAKASTQVSFIDSTLGQLRPTLQKLGLPTTSAEINDRYIEPKRPEITAIIRSFFNGFLGLLGTVGSQLLLLPLVPIIALLLLLDMDRLRAHWPNWIPPSIRRQTVSILTEVGEVFIKYLRGMTTSWALYTIFCALILSILGAPYSILLALLFGALYLIPFFGGLFNYIILLTVTVVMGVSGNNWWETGSPWIFALILLGGQFVLTWAWDTFVHPNLVGKAVGLSPVASIFVVFAGGALFGLPGMVIGFPIGGAIKVILERMLAVTSATGSDTLGLPAVPLRHRIQEG